MLYERTGATDRSGWSDYLKEGDGFQCPVGNNWGIQAEARFHCAVLGSCPQVLPFKRQSRALIGTGA